MNPSESPLAAAFLLMLAHCSSTSSVQGSEAGVGVDGGGIPLSCGSTGDCTSAGLTSYTCVYPGDAGACVAIGQCRELVMPTDTSQCTPQATVCPCSGMTQTIPPCWQGYSPVAIASYGPCSADGG